eukprot:CAMPEP_0181295316 /NCGR_PEP_ID=MMETSP1101-20121128/4079_1 /TAXON_ID=46948 /ORGANISM="Rhodomonas abbreviata, Strain Caron Lab Isolate" /LENGTH=364 /DNA_ID=CAMNT_0023400053 /DNA_START=183 /DNA_END=1274 /DNA_ORIENTATION=+
MTPAFPKNAPGIEVEFDGIGLVLMDKETPPDALLRHIDELGKEFSEEISSTRMRPEMQDFRWVVGKDPELDQVLSRESLISWDFDLFKLRDLTNGRPLAVLAYALINLHDLVNKLGLDENKLKKYLCAFEANYNNCLYHNPMHAADVMHATNYLLMGTIANTISPEELLIALLSGPAHDLGHPGVNNVLLIKQNHPVAVKYSNASVLENHHASIAIELLSRPELNVLSCFPEAKQAELKTLMRDLVLYTDMSKHMSMLERLQERVDQDRPLTLEDDSDRKFLLQTLLHTADLSNPCKAWNVHIQWTHAILAEFFSQGDRPRAPPWDGGHPHARSDGVMRTLLAESLLPKLRPPPLRQLLCLYPG